MIQPDPHHPPPRYRSYLLRVWLEVDRNQAAWRIVLIDPLTGNRRAFVDFDALTDFLREVFPADPPSTP